MTWYDCEYSVRAQSSKLSELQELVLLTSCLLHIPLIGELVMESQLPCPWKLLRMCYFCYPPCISKKAIFGIPRHAQNPGVFWFKPSPMATPWQSRTLALGVWMIAWEGCRKIWHGILGHLLADFNEMFEANANAHQFFKIYILYIGITIGHSFGKQLFQPDQKQPL